MRLRRGRAGEANAGSGRETDVPAGEALAPLIEGTDAIEQARRLTRFTAPFNFTGLPAISLPCGLSSEGMPLGLQMVAGHWFEAKLLRAAYAYEEARGEFPSADLR